MTGAGICAEVSVLPDPVSKQDVLWTCAQRAGHPGQHNRRAPRDGCTAWADHCPRCSEHQPCRCEGSR